MKTVKLKCGHEMCEEVFRDRVNFLAAALEADGMIIHDFHKNTEDADIEFIIKTQYMPRENFKQVQSLGRYDINLGQFNYYGDMIPVVKINLC
jgi:hypothetical protein